MFGVYLWYKGVLNWLEEGNKPVNVTVKNKWLMATFSLWRNKEKIYTEATFYEKVHSNVFVYNLCENLVYITLHFFFNAS